MKHIIAIYLFVSCMVNLEAQQLRTEQDFINSCFLEEIKKGASSVIFRTILCSACLGEGIYDGYIFVKMSSEKYHVRYLKYFSGNNLKILNDTTIYDDYNIKEIFMVFETNQDSIFNQLREMDKLLREKIILEDGRILYKEIPTHGKMIYIGLYNNGKSIVGGHSISDGFNDLFDKAYYYWLLSSSISNYCIQEQILHSYPLQQKLKELNKKIKRKPKK